MGYRAVAYDVISDLFGTPHWATTARSTPSTHRSCEEPQTRGSSSPDMEVLGPKYYLSILASYASIRYTCLLEYKPPPKISK